MLDFLNAIDQFGWASTPGCIPEAASLLLLAECTRAFDQGEFRRAGVGRGLNLEIRDDVRRDHVMWLPAGQSPVGQHLYLAELETLRLALNRRFFLGLFDFEGHFAIYPEGAFYRAHLDRHAGTSDRILTTILYLNPGWEPGDGGELKLWTTSGDKAGTFVLIEPRMGTLVCFLAADFWHEVLPTHKARMGITGWFRQR